jgi:hypothetical protein
MAAATVFRDCWERPEAASGAVRWEAGSRFEAGLAQGFTISFLFESFKIQKWRAIWFACGNFVKERGRFFYALNCVIPRHLAHGLRARTGVVVV